MATSSTSALRRLPLREAIASLSSPGASGSTPLPRLRRLTVKYLAKNSAPGTREFLNTILPRVAYHNPNVSFEVERIPDMRGKSKDPKDRDVGAQWAEGEKPRHEMIIELDNAPATTIDVTGLSSSAIWDTLLANVRGTSTSSTTDPTTLPPNSDAPPPAASSASATATPTI